MLPRASRKGGLTLSAGGNQRIDRPIRIAFDFESAFIDRTPHRAGRRSLVCVHGRRHDDARPKIRRRGTGLGDHEVNAERRNLLGHDSTKPSMPHLVAW